MSSATVGLANSSQKFVCADCGKTFSIKKNTIFRGTHKTASVWKEFLRCMSEGLSLDKTAKRCGITHPTTFVWRYKVLDAIGGALKRTELMGVVEPDEVFSPISYNGDASYRKFSKDNDNGLVQIKSSKGMVNGIYHIQHLNAY